MKDGFRSLSCSGSSGFSVSSSRTHPPDNLPQALKIRGELDISALREAFRTLLRRHDVLRTAFFSSLEGELFQCVLYDVDINLTIRDVSSLPTFERELETATIAFEEARKIFDLERPPLLRLTLLCLGPGEHMLILVMHHIITDGWSMSILFKELSQSYERLAAGQEPCARSKGDGRLTQ